VVELGIVGDDIEPSGGEGADLLGRFLFLFLCQMLRFRVCARREFRSLGSQGAQRFLGQVAASDEPLVSLKGRRVVKPSAVSCGASFAVGGSGR
jgi:hypothetical protein